MIEEGARVVAVEGDIAWVETRRQTACGSCAANKGCGTTVLAKVVGAKYSRLRVLNTLSARTGDEVVIGIEENALLRGSVIMYVLPILLMMVGAALGERLNEQLQLATPDVASIAAGLAGLLAGFAWISRFAGKIGRDGRYQPVMLRRADEVAVHAPLGLMDRKREVL